MKNRYDIFTKNELAEFLNKYEDMFRMMDTPFGIMVDVKMNSIMSEIEKSNEKGQILSNNYKTAKNKIDWAIEVQKNNEEWNKLNKEYDKLSNLRFGKRVEK